MKKKLILITLDKETKYKYLKDLEYFFGDLVEIQAYSIREGLDELIIGDLALITSPVLVNIVKNHLASDMNVIYMNRTFLRDKIKELYNLPQGTKAMLVSNNATVALECISALYEIGIKHIDITPVSPELEEIPELKIAITPAQFKYVPKSVERIINIDWRTLDLSTLMDIATELDIMNPELEKKIAIYSKKIIPISHGLHFTFTDNSKMKNQMEIVLDEIDDGVLITDIEHNILYCNKATYKILGLSQEEIKNNNIMKIIPEKSLSEIIHLERFGNVLVKLKQKNKSFIITKRPIKDYEIEGGYVIILKDITEIENLEKYLRTELVKKGYVTKYTFNSIVGNSKIIKSCIDKAKKIAQNDSTVLIYGETGTGKELFAQSIHNESKRKNNPFVALNCASLPTQLLESELFGYEEGAFTGAKKGGKKGLFELAHNGTIFLDEIGDMPLSIQVKLLRVLQEKEVMRIGGNSIIPVNVRVIAATNKELDLLAKQDQFRKDLYYRLSVFDLELPPLRERKSDIPSLIKDMLDNMEMGDKEIDNDLMYILINHTWEGNIRELRNCIEYLSYMGESVLTINDLPRNIKKSMYKDVNQEEESIFPELSVRENIVIKYILSILTYANSGRRQILQKLIDHRISTSEYEVRKLIDFLRAREYIYCSKGRNGTGLTEKGKKLVVNNSLKCVNPRKNEDKEF